MLYHVCMETMTRIARTTGDPDLRFTDEKKQTVCLRLRPALRREVDAFARRHGMRRTTLMEEALRFYMTVKGLDTPTQDTGNGR